MTHMTRCDLIIFDNYVMIDNEARWEDNFDKIVVSFLETENKISFEAKVLSIKWLHAIIYLLSNSC